MIQSPFLNVIGNISMNGNGRWARQRGIPGQAGQRAGTENVRRIVAARPGLGFRS